MSLKGPSVCNILSIAKSFTLASRDAFFFFFFFLPKPTFEPPTQLFWKASGIPGGAVGSLSLHRTIRLAVGDLVSCLVMESSAELSESLSVWSS